MKFLIRIYIRTIILFLPNISYAQINEDCYINKYFLIIKSTRDYQSALATAKEATQDLNVKLDLRNLIPCGDPLIGLTLPADTCLKYLQEYGTRDSTCYLARGRWDDGTYISIEYSNAYYNFEKGYYIVMVGSGFKKDRNLVEALKKVKHKYSDAYIKASKVYMCCMH